VESGSLSPTEMEAETVVAKDLVVDADVELERRLRNLRERLGARERVKEIGAVKAAVGESNGLATEMAVAEEDERSLETEREVAMDEMFVWLVSELRSS